MTAEERLQALITGAEYENMSAGQYGEFAVLAADAIKLLRRIQEWDIPEHEWNCQTKKGQGNDGVWPSCTCGLVQLHEDLDKFLDGGGSDELDRVS